jgi:methylated-DNA-[protein]-cysteine S-methyltransferase
MMAMASHPAPAPTSGVELVHWHQPSPVGRLLAAASPTGLALLSFTTDDDALDRAVRGFGPGTVAVAGRQPETEAAIAAWFDGDLSAVEGIPVDLTLARGWRRQVLDVLRELRPGELVTYGELAVRAGRTGAARAAGQAVGANPVAVVVPCHRVVASDGTLGGFSGGLARKRWLLAHEGVSARPGGWPVRDGRD